MGRNNLNHCTASEMLFWLFWNAWAKSVIKVFRFYCLKRLRSQTPSESNDCIYCISPARSEGQVIHYIWKWLYYNKWLLQLFLVIIVPVYQEVTIMFSSTFWTETVLYTQRFYAIFQFCTQVKFESLDGNIAIKLASWTWEPDQCMNSFELEFKNQTDSITKKSSPRWLFFFLASFVTFGE